MTTTTRLFAAIAMGCVASVWNVAVAETHTANDSPKVSDNNYYGDFTYTFSNIPIPQFKKVAPDAAKGPQNGQETGRQRPDPVLPQRQGEETDGERV